MSRSIHLIIASSILLLFSTAVISQDRPEISNDEVRSERVEFINRTGRPASRNARLIELQTGENMGAAMRSGKTEVNINGVSIRRVFKADLAGFGADILIVNPGANYGHINALHRVLSSYIANAFEYKLNDADILARYILYYNAHHRNDLAGVQKKYSSDVVSSLDPDKIGIDRNYKNWSGKTQILIPLKKNIVRPNGTDLNNGELDKTVGDEATKKEQTEIEKIQAERKAEDLKKLDEKEKDLTKEEARLKQEEKQLASEEKKTQDEIKQTDKKIEELKKEPVKNAEEIKKQETRKQDLAKKQSDTAGKKDTVKKDQAKVQSQKQEVADQKQDAKEKPDAKTAEKTDPRVAQLEKENQQLKEAEQAKQEKSANVVGEKILFMRVTETTENNHFNSELWAIDTLNDDALFRSPYQNICGREFTVVPGQGILVIGFPGETSHTTEHHLVLLDSESLTMKKEGSDIIYFKTPVRMMDGKLFVIVIHESMYYIARFNPDLSLDVRGDTPISSDSEITFTKEKIYLTGKKTDGSARISVFRRTDLSHIKTFEPKETKKGALN